MRRSNAVESRVQYKGEEVQKKKEKKREKKKGIKDQKKQPKTQTAAAVDRPNQLP